MEETPAVTEKEEPAKRMLMRKILMKAGIDIPVADDMSFHQFFWAVMHTRKIATKADLHRASGLRRRFLSRFESFDSMPKSGGKKIWAEDNYRTMARALGLDENLFIALVKECGGNTGLEHRENKTANEEKVDEMCRVYRIALMRFLGIERLQDPRDECEREKSVEDLLGQFADEIRALERAAR